MFNVEKTGEMHNQLQFAQSLPIVGPFIVSPLVIAGGLTHAVLGVVWALITAIGSLLTWCCKGTSHSLLRTTKQTLGSSVVSSMIAGMALANTLSLGFFYGRDRCGC